MPQHAEIPQGDGGEFPPENTRSRFPALAADPYAIVDLSPESRESISQMEVMRENPAIAPYLGGGSDGWTTARIRRTVVAAGLSLLFLLLFIFLPGWDMVRGYVPPALSETPKPRPYAGALPPVYESRLQAIHADITAGNRVKAAYDKLASLLDDVEKGDLDVPAGIAAWTRTELLVALASKEIPPTAFQESFPDHLYSGLSGGDGDARPSFRALAAYVRAAEKNLGGSNPSPERLRNTAEAIELLRGEYPGDMDEERDLLTIEAAHHIAALPGEYTPDDRLLEYHWRRAAHAIGRLYSMYGIRDGGARSLDRKRWRTVRSYFSLTLLTLDASRLGWRKSVVLDGREYGKAEVDRILQQLKG